MLLLVKSAFKYLKPDFIELLFSTPATAIYARLFLDVFDYLFNAETP